MPSSTYSRSTAGGYTHKINTLKDVQLQQVYYERTVSKGQPITQAFKVKEYYTEREHDLSIPVQQVESFEQYAAGCTLHDDCLGHFCITPRGTILLPQRLASTLGVMSNDYAKMAENVFKRDSISQENEYRTRLRDLMLKKSGKMRGDMPAGTVDCSMREVISTCWEMPPGYIAIPRKVANNMRVLRIAKDKSTGLPLEYYVEDRVREEESYIVNTLSDDGRILIDKHVTFEGDYNIGVRPPSLWAGNVQPMKVILWDHECLGLSPSNADEFHADHDGDEFQTYHLTETESLEQCKLWKQLSECKFENAVRTLPLPDSCYRIDKFGPISRSDPTLENKREKFHEYLGLREKFMVHSTLSIKELEDGVKLPDIAKAAKVKDAMADMLAARLRDPGRVFEDFYSESIRGIKDVMAQRLNQGDLGDMTRQAKLSASCIKYKGYGKFEIKTSTGSLSIFDLALQTIGTDLKYPLGGNPCVRAVSAICAVAQQAALDSHRVSQEVSSSLDLVDNIIKGGAESLVVFQGTINLQCTWKYYDGRKTYCIIKNDSVKNLATKVVAAYNPIVLHQVKAVNGDIKQVCRNGILIVCNYYGVKLSKIELHSLAELLCYKCTPESSPSTVKDGLNTRGLRWMTTVFANHFGLLAKMQNRGLTKYRTKPETITEATAFCNFDYI